MLEIIIIIIFGFFLGDLFAGIFHFWEDRYGNEEWEFSKNPVKRLVYQHVVKANIEHHMHPTNTCKRSYWYRCGGSILLTLPFIIICVYFQLYLLAVAFAVLSQANEVHSWSHQRMGRFIRFFQKTGFLCSPQHHAIHHKRPYDQRYCVMSNWLNPVLQKIRFWRFLERTIGLIFRIKPNPARNIY